MIFDFFVWIDIVMADIVTELYEYRVILFILFGIIAFLIFSIVVTIKYMDSFKRQEIDPFLIQPITSDSYFMKEADRCYYYFAKSAAFRQRGNDTNSFYSKIRDKLKPLLFELKDSKLYISSQFSEFILQQPGRHIVGEFFKFCKAYVKYMHHDVAGINHMDAEFEANLVSDVVDRVMETEAARQEVERRIGEAVPVPVISDNSNDVDIYAVEKKELMRRLSLSTFNCAIRDIKLHDGIGMIPANECYLKHVLYNMVCKLRIYTQQKIKGMVHSEEASVLDCEGCYIVLNTFNSKYFVGRSDMMFSRVYGMVISCNSDPCAELVSDLNDGHLVLVKFVPLEQSGYTDIVKMQRDLVLAYDCRQGNGYNR